jgi:hypothetical protein
LARVADPICDAFEVYVREFPLWRPDITEAIVAIPRHEVEMQVEDCLLGLLAR